MFSFSLSIVHSYYDNDSTLYIISPIKHERAFDASLKSRDPSWGIRDLENVIEVAEENGLTFERMVEMPVNNWCILFQKQT